MSEQRGAGQSDSDVGLMQISVYIPADLLTRLRQRAKKERRSLSAEIVLALENYEADQSPEAARQLRAALDREGYPTT